MFQVFISRKIVFIVSRIRTKILLGCCITYDLKLINKNKEFYNNSLHDNYINPPINQRIASKILTDLLINRNKSKLQNSSRN